MSAAPWVPLIYFMPPFDRKWDSLQKQPGIDRKIMPGVFVLAPQKKNNLKMIPSLGARKMRGDFRGPKNILCRKNWEPIQLLCVAKHSHNTLWYSLKDPKLLTYVSILKHPLHSESPICLFIHFYCFLAILVKYKEAIAISFILRWQILLHTTRVVCRVSGHHCTIVPVE